MAYQMKYGTYVFPPGWSPADVPDASVVPRAKLPRADGARTLPALRTEKVITIRGGFIADPGQDVRTKVDALQAALNSGSQNLYFNTDRYWRNCQKEQASFGYEGSGWGRIMTATITFVTGDPFQYDTTVQNASQAISASPTSVTLTPGGNAYALPSLSLTIGGSGAITLAATLTNSTTGDACTLAGSVHGGDVIVLDGLNETVTISGADRTDLFDGLFPRLFVGANSLQVAYTSGTITNFAASWNNRYY